MNKKISTCKESAYNDMDNMSGICNDGKSKPKYELSSKFSGNFGTLI